MKLQSKTLEVESENARLKERFKELIVRGASGILKDEFEIQKVKLDKLQKEHAQLKQKYLKLSENSKREAHDNQLSLRRIVDAHLSERLSLTEQVKLYKAIVGELKSENKDMKAIVKEQEGRLEQAQLKINRLEQGQDELQEAKLYLRQAKEHELRANQSADRVQQLEHKLEEMRVELQMSVDRADFFEQ